jgi:hypothetical protein
MTEALDLGLRIAGFTKNSQFQAVKVGLTFVPTIVQ